MLKVHDYFSFSVCEVVVIVTFAYGTPDCTVYMFGWRVDIQVFLSWRTWRN